MLVLTKEDFLASYDKYISAIKEGAIFIYPTDTIYGIGCDATNDSSVLKIRMLKERDQKPFSVIAPNKRWIKDNFALHGHDDELKKLPGPYTFILEAKKAIISKNVNPGSTTLGVRIPDNWFSSMVINRLRTPIVTTSVNKAGKPFMTSINDCDKDILNNVDFIVYEGEKKGRPSALVKITKEGMQEVIR